MFGIIQYDDSGLPVCEICGESFHRLLTHVRQRHGINKREYKIKYGLDLKKGICSRESSKKTRDKIFTNYDICIKQNLTKKGSRTRFKAGHLGRTKEQVSEQTRLMLRERLKQPYMVQAMKKNGKRVGKLQLTKGIKND